ncbi:A/G-specific adenine glycosylase [Persicobacter diffluens]|uniref:Adenine DNA glycosylase n=1 Tax=Persicobacter diffluens TaxID=981 RepID=A0AAN4VV74_9BACT|nr:A/G-specific adenine glycosylase [Persicobacter diffluens]
MQDFVNKIVSWYEKNHRQLPWRETHDPYRIWLSEIILQQTRVEQGRPYYEQFTTEHPNIQSLAEANEESILRLWQGLGYYSRARNLHKCAKTVMAEHGGHFPKKFEDLKKLPGIGPYTAAAIASFAFGEKVACVDGNVYRLLSRFFGISDDIASPKGQKVFFEKAQSLIPSDRPDLFNQATMEMGAMVCTPKKPNCMYCPLQAGCFAFEHNKQEELPVKTKKVKVKKRYLHYLIIKHEGEVLMKKRDTKGIWAGLYDFPLIEGKEAIVDFDDLLENTPNFNGGKFLLGQISQQYKHVLTHQQLFVRFFEISTKNQAAFQQVKEAFQSHSFPLEETMGIPKPILIDQYLKEHQLEGVE